MASNIGNANSPPPHSPEKQDKLNSTSPDEPNPNPKLNLNPDAQPQASIKSFPWSSKVESDYTLPVTFIDQAVERVQESLNSAYTPGVIEPPVMRRGVSRHEYYNLDSPIIRSPAAPAPAQQPLQHEAQGAGVMKIQPLKDLERTLQVQPGVNPMAAAQVKVQNFLTREGSDLIAKIPSDQRTYITPKGKIFVELQALGAGSFQQTTKVALIGHAALQNPGAVPLQYRALSMPKENHDAVDPQTQFAEMEAAKLEVPNVIEIHKHLKSLRTTRHGGELVFKGSLSHLAGARTITYSPTGGSCLLTEFCNGGNADTFLERAMKAGAAEAETPQNKMQAAYFMAAEMCKGVKQLHAAGLVHRDLKPDNFFLQVDERGNVQKVMLGDFSKCAYNKTWVPGGKGYIPLFVLAKYNSAEDLDALKKDVASGKIDKIFALKAQYETSVQRLKESIALQTAELKEALPNSDAFKKINEMLVGLQSDLQKAQNELNRLHGLTEIFYSESSDIYQMGITLYQILCNIPTAQLDLKNRPKFDTLEDDVRQLINSMIQKDASKRPTAAQVEAFFRAKLAK